MSRVVNVTALIERISGTPEHPLDRLMSSCRCPPSVTVPGWGSGRQDAVVLTCAMGTVLIDSSSAPGCERLPDAGKQGGPRAA